MGVGEMSKSEKQRKSWRQENLLGVRGSSTMLYYYTYILLLHTQWIANENDWNNCLNENKKEPSIDGLAQDTHWRSYITILYIEDQAIIEKLFKFLAREINDQLLVASHFFLRNYYITLCDGGRDIGNEMQNHWMTRNFCLGFNIIKKIL